VLSGAFEVAQSIAVAALFTQSLAKLDVQVFYAVQQPLEQYEGSHTCSLVAMATAIQKRKRQYFLTDINCYNF
jgi:hypothetical protein